MIRTWNNIISIASTLGLTSTDKHWKKHLSCFNSGLTTTWTNAISLNKWQAVRLPHHLIGSRAVKLFQWIAFGEWLHKMLNVSNKLLLLHCSRISQSSSKTYVMPFLKQITIILGRQLVIEYIKLPVLTLPYFQATINS